MMPFSGGDDYQAPNIPPPTVLAKLREAGLSHTEGSKSPRVIVEEDAKAIATPVRIHTPTESERARKMMEKTRRAYLGKAGVTAHSNTVSLSRLKNDGPMLRNLAKDMQHGYQHSGMVRDSGLLALRNVNDTVKGVLIQDQRRGRKVYKRVFMASEAVTWLLTYCKHKRFIVEKSGNWKVGDERTPKSTDPLAVVGNSSLKLSIEDTPKSVGRAVDRHDAVGMLQELLTQGIIFGAMEEKIVADNKSLFCFKDDIVREETNKKPTDVRELDLGLSPLDLSVKLLDLALELFRGVREGRVCIHNLHQVASQPKWKEFSQELTKLEKVDLKPLTHEKRLCFFLNIYNVLNMHACAVRLPSRSARSSRPSPASKSLSQLSSFDSSASLLSPSSAVFPPELPYPRSLMSPTISMSPQIFPVSESRRTSLGSVTYLYPSEYKKTLAFPPLNTTEVEILLKPSTSSSSSCASSPPSVTVSSCSTTSVNTEFPTPSPKAQESKESLLAVPSSSPPTDRSKESLSSSSSVSPAERNVLKGEEDENINSEARRQSLTLHEDCNTKQTPSEKKPHGEKRNSVGGKRNSIGGGDRKARTKSGSNRNSSSQAHSLTVTFEGVKDFWEPREHDQQPSVEVKINNKIMFRTSVEANSSSGGSGQKGKMSGRVEEIEINENIHVNVYYLSTDTTPCASCLIAVSQLLNSEQAEVGQDSETEEWFRVTRSNVTIGRVCLRFVLGRLEDSDRRNDPSSDEVEEECWGTNFRTDLLEQDDLCRSPPPFSKHSAASTPAASPSSHVSGPSPSTSLKPAVKSGFAYLTSWFSSEHAPSVASSSSTSRTSEHFSSCHSAGKFDLRDMLSAAAHHTHHHSSSNSLFSPVSRRLRLRSSFYQNSVYNIGGLWYSLYDLEHRVIRSTHSPLLLPELKKKIGSRLFKRTDPRREFVIDHWDTRVNFALGHGVVSSSCVRVIRSPAALDETLTLCVRDMLKHQLKLHLIAGPKLDLHSPVISRLLVCPPWVFHAFKADFGSPTQVLEWMLPHLPISLRMELCSQWQDAVQTYDQEADDAKLKKRKLTRRPPVPYSFTQDFDNSFYYDVSTTESKPRKCDCARGNDAEANSTPVVDLLALGLSDIPLQGVATIIDNPVLRWANKEREWFSHCVTWNDLIAIILDPEYSHPFQTTVRQFVSALKYQADITTFQMECDIMSCSGLSFVIKFLSSLYQLVCASCPLCDSNVDPDSLKPPPSVPGDFSIFQVDSSLSIQFNILRLLERRVFDEVFAVVFLWYQKRYIEADSALAIKRQQLEGVSLRHLGVEPPYLLSELRPDVSPLTCGCNNEQNVSVIATSTSQPSDLTEVVISVSSSFANASPPLSSSSVTTLSVITSSTGCSSETSGTFIASDHTVTAITAAAVPIEQASESTSNDDDTNSILPLQASTTIQNSSSSSSSFTDSSLSISFSPRTAVPTSITSHSAHFLADPLAASTLSPTEESTELADNLSEASSDFPPASDFSCFSPAATSSSSSSVSSSFSSTSLPSLVSCSAHDSSASITTATDSPSVPSSLLPFPSMSSLPVGASGVGSLDAMYSSAFTSPPSPSYPESASPPRFGSHVSSSLGQTPRLLSPLPSHSPLPSPSPIEHVSAPAPEPYLHPECVHGRPYADAIRLFNQLVRLKSPSVILGLLGSVIDKIDHSVVDYWHHPSNVSSRPKSISLTAEDIVVIFTYVLSKANPNALSSLTALGYFLSDYFERCLGMHSTHNESGTAFNDYYESVFLGPAGFSLASTQAATGYMNSVDNS